jgi:hypothetical protein
MRSQTYLHAPSTVRFSPRPDFSRKSFSGGIAGAAQTFRRVVALTVALLLLTLGQEEVFAQQAPSSEQESPQNYSQDDNGQYPPAQQSDDGQAQPQAQPLSAEQLEQLVAPIALYPDTLVAQVLAASTYPVQVVNADRWRQAQGNASPDQIAAGADAQNWDPSVKALTAFPQVLAQMDQNLQWTTELGNAYYNQPQDVLQTVQIMRQRAQAAGNLQSTPQEAVSYDQGNIELAPVNPQLVYVPAYNPWTVYGQPVSPYPGFSLFGALGSVLGSSFASSFGSSPINFGLGIAMTAFSHTPWGWLAWGLSWLSQSVLFNHSNYYSHSTTVADWGFPHGGVRAFSGGAIGRFSNSYNRGREFVPRPPGNYARLGSGYNETRGREFVPRPPSNYSRSGNGYNEARGRQFVPRPPSSYSRSSGEYNVARGREFVPRPAVSRPQQYSRSAYASNAYSRPGAGYSRGRVPASSFQRSNFGKQSSKSFAKYSQKQSHSGGFHMFGGGHSSKNFGGGGHFSHGHSGGGGHSGGHSSGRHHH